MSRRLIDADALTDDILKSAVMIDDRGIQTGYEIAIELIKRQPTIDAEPQWIPVSEKLPDALESVLVTSTHGHVYISYIVHGEFEYGGEVIAWMPLPKPYEVKE